MRALPVVYFLTFAIEMEIDVRAREGVWHLSSEKFPPLQGQGEPVASFIKTLERRLKLPVIKDPSSVDKNLRFFIRVASKF